jgi:hypothetical protein
LVRIVIPNWHCPEVGDLVLLTAFLIARTFLSVYLATVNGRIVQAIIDKNLSLFIKRVQFSLCRSSGSVSLPFPHHSSTPFWIFSIEN